MTARCPFEIRIGCAGWSLRKECASAFADGASHLARYATRLSAVEINSSFYRPHRPETYARWASSVPENFRFAAKMPKEITHVQRLADTKAALDRFLGEVKGLASKLGPLLVQLPPSLNFDGRVAETFFRQLRDRFAGHVVCEPRRATWFEPDATQLLIHYRVARVAADPAVVPAAAEPGAGQGLVYYRLHGSPDVYYSSYSDGYLTALASMIARQSATAPVWCIFDNTARGAATANALELAALAQRALTTTAEPSNPASH